MRWAVAVDSPANLGGTVDDPVFRRRSKMVIWGACLIVVGGLISISFRIFVWNHNLAFDPNYWSDPLSQWKYAWFLIALLMLQVILGIFHIFLHNSSRGWLKYFIAYFSLFLILLTFVFIDAIDMHTPIDTWTYPDQAPLLFFIAAYPCAFLMLLGSILVKLATRKPSKQPDLKENDMC